MTCNILLTNKKITHDQLKALCTAWFDDMVKIVADIRTGWIGIGGDLHADAETLLLKKDFRQEDLWGANMYPWHKPEERIEYTALINIRPRFDHPFMEIQDEKVRSKVKSLVENLILGSDEELV